jgi:hypothetical protein
MNVDAGHKGSAPKGKKKSTTKLTKVGAGSYILLSNHYACYRHHCHTSFNEKSKSPARPAEDKDEDTMNVNAGRKGSAPKGKKKSTTKLTKVGTSAPVSTKKPKSPARPAEDEDEDTMNVDAGRKGSAPKGKKKSTMKLIKVGARSYILTV